MCYFRFCGPGSHVIQIQIIIEPDIFTQKNHHLILPPKHAMTLIIIIIIISSSSFNGYCFYWLLGYASDMQTFLHLFCIWTVVASLNVISRAEHHNIFVWSDSQLSDGAFLAYLSVFASHFNIASVIEFVQLFMISYLFLRMQDTTICFFRSPFLVTVNT